MNGNGCDPFIAGVAKNKVDDFPQSHMDWFEMKISEILAQYPIHQTWILNLDFPLVSRLMDKIHSHG
jgi:hypothetical protein